MDSYSDLLCNGSDDCNISDNIIKNDTDLDFTNECIYCNISNAIVRSDIDFTNECIHCNISDNIRNDTDFTNECSYCNYDEMKEFIDNALDSCSNDPE